MPYILLVLSTLFWSGNFVLSRGMHTEIPPVGLAFWRWLVALILLLPFFLCLGREQWALMKKNSRYLTCQGLLGVTGFNTLIYIAMQSTTAINAVLVNSCIPILIVVLSWILFREKLSLRQGIGVTVSLGGVLYILAKGEISTLLLVSFNPGDLLVVAAACVWALYSVNLKKYPQGLAPIAYMSGIVFTGTCFLLPIYFFEIQSGRFVQFNTGTVMSVLYVAIFASILAFLCWNKAVREIGANRAGPFIHLMPVFSTILAIIFLNESLEKHHIAGVSLVFSGIFLATFMEKSNYWK